MDMIALAGKTLCCSNTIYLQPQIECIGIASNQSVTLYQKLFYRAELCTVTLPLLGCSTKIDTYVSKSEKSTLNGLENDARGNWPNGNYRYEIWYGSTCLKAVDFYVY